MTLPIREVVAALSNAFPLQTVGYEKDAVGLQVGFDDGAELTRMLIAYEVTDAVIDEALSIGANLIIAYHPLIFPNVTSVSDANRTGKLVRRLIRASIALYVLHTAFDANVSFGTSALMAGALGLKNVSSLAPLERKLEKLVVFVPTTHADAVREAMWAAGTGGIGNYDECSFSSDGFGTFRAGLDANPAIGMPLVRERVSETRIEMIVESWKVQRVLACVMAVHPYEEVAYDRYSLANGHPNFGMGSVGDLSDAVDVADALKLISRTFKTPLLRHSMVTKPNVKRIALLGGAGMEYYSAARRAGADVFVTGDVRYHDFYRAEHDNVLLIDAGHAETEQWVVAGMRNAIAVVDKFVDLQKDIQDSRIVESRILPNAVRYYLSEA